MLTENGWCTPAQCGFGNLSYQTRLPNGTWITDVIEDNFDTYQATLALDSAGAAHVVWIDVAGLHYGIRAPAGGWAIQTFTAWGPDGTSYPHEATLLYDHHGQLWMEGSNDAGHLVFGRINDNSTFTYVVVYDAHTGGGCGATGPNNVAFDSHDQAHIVCEAFGQLHYWSEDANGTWTDQIVDPFNDSDASLAIDPYDVPHIAFSAGPHATFSGGSAWYATLTATGWDVESLDRTTDGAYSTSLALDAHGLPHVAYYRFPAPQIPGQLERATFAYASPVVASAPPPGISP